MLRFSAAADAHVVDMVIGISGVVAGRCGIEFLDFILARLITAPHGTYVSTTVVKTILHLFQAVCIEGMRGEESARLFKHCIVDGVQNLLHAVFDVVKRQVELLQSIPAQAVRLVLLQVTGTDFKPQRNTFEFPLVEFETGLSARRGGGPAADGPARLAMRPAL